MMKSRRHINTKVTLVLGIILSLTLGCERETSENVTFATFSNDGRIFIDSFSPGLEYLPFAGSKFEAFTVDTDEVFQGAASMRFDVPNFGDPDGSFAGAIFPNDGRDLTDFDALTFYAKASVAATINEIGYGDSFGENRFLVGTSNLRLTTNWRKYIIPIPDPSKLTFERGMFWYAEGPEEGNGYTFWIDELQFEKLGTIAQPNPAILSGEDRVRDLSAGSVITIDGLSQTLNLADGSNVTLATPPSYFNFSSSNATVAHVNDLGVVTVIGSGTAEITATITGVVARGSLTINSN